MAKLDARPPSFITQPPAERANGMVLLSGGDRNAALAERVVQNHATFAARHGYAHWWHRGSLAETHGWLPYWHKVAQLREAIDSAAFASARAFVWVDDDVILTNHREGEDMLLRALGRTNASVIVTRDPAHAHTGIALNTGILVVRRDASAREVLDEMWRRATLARPDGLTLATDPQSAGCLHEQQALQEMLEGETSSAYWRQRVAVLEQRAPRAPHEPMWMADGRPHARQDGRAEQSREPPVDEPTSWNLNTFLRWSHHNAERGAEMLFDADAYGSGWTRGDFSGHCSGLTPMRRALCVGVLLGAVVS